MTHLWSDAEGSLMQHLPCLRHLRIDRCPNLVSLASEEVVEEERLQQGWLSKLTQIEINTCIALESLPKAMMYNSTSCLKLIRIVKCDSLKHIAKGQLPPTLERLEVSYCQNMEIILLVDSDTSSCSSSTASRLEYLEIYHCPSLELLTSSGELPATLRSLRMRSCPKLESIAASLQHNSFLESIDVSFCEKLKSLPRGIHSLSSLVHIYIERCQSLDFSWDQESFLPANLRELDISGCDQVRSLPIGIQSHTSLQKLTIDSCPDVSFPEGGFPTSITSLSISHHKITDALFDWGLNKLTSLDNLQISKCPHLVSFPEGFQEIKGLKELFISECGEFVSFSKDVLPASLQKLCINKCEKLESFPENGVPLSLQQLYIFECPLLERRCEKDQGPEWRKISYVPSLKFG